MTVKTLAFFNHKGGVTKSTSTALTSLLLATDSHEKIINPRHFRKGEKVLVVDLDSQCNLTHILTKNEAGIEIKGGALDAIGVGDATDFIVQIPSKPNLYLLPGTRSLSLFEEVVFKNDLMKHERYEYLLNDVLQTFVKENDISYVLIDFAPSSTRLMRQGLNVHLGGETLAVLPFQLNDLGNESLIGAGETVRGIQVNSNANLKVIGLLPVLLQKTENAYLTVFNEAKEAYGDLVFSSIIFNKKEIVKITTDGFTEKYKKQRDALEMYYELLAEIKERI